MKLKGVQPLFLQLFILLLFFGLTLYIMHLAGIMPLWMTYQDYFLVDEILAFVFELLWYTTSKTGEKPKV